MTLGVRNLWRKYPNAPEPTLKGITFELPKGTLTALLGRSGAGKSTLLRCVMGLEPFERGELLIDDVVVQGTEEVSPGKRAEQLARARERMGLVFQSFELFPHLTAIENCMLAPMKVKRQSNAVARKRCEDLLASLGLAHHVNAHPDMLSGGQKQRVAIARALAMEPGILLYDEPTSALDPSLKNEVLQTLKRVDATEVTQVVVTHDLQLARGVEHVIVLANGQVMEAGPPEKVLQNPEHQSTRELLSHWA